MSSIIELVTAAITPAIQTPYELVDVEYGKMGGDYVLSILSIRRVEFPFKIRQIYPKRSVRFWTLSNQTHFQTNTCWR